MARHDGPEDTGTNENGFALVAVLAGLPLLVALLVGLSVIALALKNRTVTYAACRWSAFQAQKEMGVSLQHLTSLNPKAQRLRIRRRQAEAEVKAAAVSGVMPLMIAAQARRVIVLTEQMHLRAEQERLLFNATMSRAKARQALTAELKSKSGRLLETVSPSKSLAIRRVPALDITPDHVPSPAFAREQILKFQWQGRLFSGAPAWLLRAGDFTNLKFDGECAATLHQENKKWHPRLVAAKSLLK